MNFIFNKKKIYCFIVLLLVWFGVLSFAVNNVFAIDTVLPGATACDCKVSNIEESCKQYCGDYELNDFIGLVVQVSKIILGLVGSLALLAFVYGGIMFLVSSGNSETVTKAKQIIIGAVIGLVIVFASYMIIGFVFTALDAKNASTWFKSP